MTEHEQNRHLDELLDSALSSYSAVEPGPGLETRVLANLREAERKQASRPWNFKWMWAGAAVVAAVLVLVLATVSHKPVAGPGNTVAHTQPAAPVPMPVQQKPPADGSNLRQRPQRHAPAQVENAALPLNQRPSVFPSPSPLSEQEKFLLSYYLRTPREELVAQSHPDEPPAVDSEGDIALPDLVSVPQRSSNTR